MGRPLRLTLFLTTAVVTAAVVLFLSATLPPRTVRFDGRLPDTLVPGAYHIHTRRSDGTGSVDAVATAAARAGLRFVILTDHGDATRVPDPPAYRDGVLCIDAVEISTTDGHLVALGLDGAAPYPLGGEARDVIDDVHRLGGLAIAAHPDSPKPELRWRGGARGLDGIEWINADSEWRDESAGRLAAIALRSLVRGPESLAALLSRPVRTLRRWDAGAAGHPLFGLAAVDAHARIGWQQDEEPRQRTLLARPTYEQMFRTLVQTVELAEPLSGDAVADARRLIGAIGAGRSVSAVRAFAWPASLTFSGSAEGRSIAAGERVPEGSPVVLTATVPQAPGADVAIYVDGRELAAGRGSVRRTVTAAGVYRAEAAWRGAAVPWLVSNPIVIASSESGTAAPDTTSNAPAGWHALPDDSGPWTIEREPSSSGTISPAGDETAFAFTLAPGAPAGQYAALAANVGTPAGVDRLRFTARADRPMRISVQVRLAANAATRRWRRSIYLDATARRIDIPLRDFTPVGERGGGEPVAAPLQTLLFVVDTVNTAPGASGTIWISDAAVGLARFDTD